MDAKLRATRLLRVGAALERKEPPRVPKMVLTEEEYRGKFPDRYKSLMKWRRQFKVLLDLQENFIKKSLHIED